jgi:tyrosyl-tRNA synthetase
MPLLEGLDGVNKMSKSLGNYVGITDAPNDMFGKLMSVSDDLMWRYIELLSFEPTETLRLWQGEVREGRNPRDIKVAFAQEIITRFHSRRAAESALVDFETRFRQGGLPEDLPEVTVVAPEGGLAIALVLKLAGLTTSTSEALRMLDQGGVRIDGDKVSNRSLMLSSARGVVLQVGKRKYARVRIEIKKGEG